MQLSCTNLAVSLSEDVHEGAVDCYFSSGDLWWNFTQNDDENDDNDEEVYPDCGYNMKILINANM